MNNLDDYTKKRIDSAIDTMLKDIEKTMITCNELIRLMTGEEGLKGHLAFYKSILEDLLTDHTKVNYIEKEQFLILHKCLVETYNELS